MKIDPYCRRQGCNSVYTFLHYVPSVDLPYISSLVPGASYTRAAVARLP